MVTMTSLALARSWRPKTFSQLVGQDHVVKALTHALDQGRLHHAWLFTGTRGVGKTTIARIMAKALNCTGSDGSGKMTSEPCGKCPACLEIDAGRFVDYIEMDAASNRGVDDIAALLEKAAYAPSNARYKVYMIDEVHMLTNHAFNAMLKTLEEPPEHVKFILATTDPQKIPVTILSRCLQFNLKQMPVPLIVEHLEKVLAAENVQYQANALRVLAKAAQGSMRDALSLTDQAIAYAAGIVSEEAVRGMLGTLDDAYLVRILDSLTAKDGAALLATANEMGERSMSFSLALADLSSLLQKIAAAQVVPESVLEDWPEAGDIRRLAQSLSREEVQLFYQISITSRPDLSLAPDEQTGFAMTLLRMLAFRPGSETVRAGGGTVPPPPSATPRPSAPAPATRPAPTASAAPLTPTVSAPAAPAAAMATAHAADRPDWHALMRQLPVRGLVQQLAFQTELQVWDDSPAGVRATIVTPMPQLASEASVGRLADALTAHFGKPVKVLVEKGEVEGKTVAKVDAQIHQEKRQNAEQMIAADPFIQQLEKEFGAKVVGGSVKAL
ncbi:DNA polymerase-3 subunit gamma/tau [Polynucleobacter sphagniphilus]|uniref:DNA polymerase III subunit gamma/tau n=2 Tax=Polynucleobacter sphagniphilus TaxID=1743169 RepID=A0AA43MBV3_9BURK|nr:DNA polymerase-3 subunit gamma/tau [Polynucleobacter sphagniphilus]MDH6300001.1 DNA polymerase-3 subunit gamma/tau [Polynucleobacter sphagniphilus]MDH6504704.1 DNA polymerase-3 subunit gamma/tau [Polynucleobacter sphagniphilus]MDH6513339.1 DNA polymerase-3 subunit gamma/tau [Polynucleobacter sphagniphilus]